eukprot:jgi/Chlat1/1128/Chrsp111S01598
MAGGGDRGGEGAGGGGEDEGWRCGLKLAEGQPVSWRKTQPVMAEAASWDVYCGNPVQSTAEYATYFVSTTFTQQPDQLLVVEAASQVALCNFKQAGASTDIDVMVSTDTATACSMESSVEHRLNTAAKAIARLEANSDGEALVSLTLQQQVNNLYQSNFSETFERDLVSGDCCLRLMAGFDNGHEHDHIDKKWSRLSANARVTTDLRRRHSLQLQSETASGLQSSLSLSSYGAPEVECSMKSSLLPAVIGRVTLNAAALSHWNTRVLLRPLLGAQMGLDYNSFKQRVAWDINCEWRCWSACLRCNADKELSASVEFNGDSRGVAGFARVGTEDSCSQLAFECNL